MNHHRPLNNSLHPNWRPLPTARQDQLTMEVVTKIIPTLREEFIRLSKATNKELTKFEGLQDPTGYLAIAKLKQEHSELTKKLLILSQIERGDIQAYVDIDGEFTTATIVTDQNTLFVGVSRKSKKDKPNTHLGIQLALHRALTKIVKGTHKTEDGKERRCHAFKVTHVKNS